MRELWARAREKWVRDRALPLPVVFRRSLSFATSLLYAQVYLRSANKVGRQVRCVGRPRIDNLGHLEIGARTLLRSVCAPVELATGVGARLVIGRDCSINYGASLGATGLIQLGDRVRMGPYAMVVDTHFHDPYDRTLRPAPEPVLIEDDVWIGAKASVLPGVRIGRGAIVATAAVVTRDVPALAVVAGVPARLVRQLDPARFVPGRGGP